MLRIKEKKQHKQKKISQKFSRLVLKIIGWKIQGEPPPTPRYVMIGYPHTSNWDVPIGLLIFTALGVRLHWVGKDSLFKSPLGWALKKLGGIPVDRNRSQNFVAQVVDKFKELDELVLTLSPEGTRSKSEYWRSGFYHIAIGAQAPIALAFLDYKKKVGGFGPFIRPGGDIKKDLAQIKAFYQGISGKIARNSGAIRLRSHRQT